MNVLKKLKSEIEVCDLHANRLSVALRHIEPLFPLTPEKLEVLKDEEIGFLELMSSRFAKLQDTIGRKIFPLLLMTLDEYEESNSFIDRLNKLEKLEILKDLSLWNRMRKVRNEIAHDYPGDSDQKALKIKHCFESSHSLLSFWEDLKKIMIQRTLVSNIN